MTCTINCWLKKQINLRRSLVIGDKLSNIGARQSEGYSSFLVGPEQSLLNIARAALAEADMLDE